MDQSRHDAHRDREGMVRGVPKMEILDVVQDLRGLGFTEVEARAYVLLLHTVRSMTGYEVAKELGTSRANAYAALRRLQHKGYANVTVEGRAATYQALPFRAVAAATMASLRGRIDRLTIGLDTPDQAPHTFTGVGWDFFVVEGSRLIAGARRRLDLGATAQPIRRLADPLNAARARSVRTRYSCWDGCPPEGCGVCRRPLARPGPKGLRRPCVVVVDSRIGLSASDEDGKVSVVITEARPLVLGLQRLVCEPEELRDSPYQ